MSGPIPPELGKLSNLDTLNLGITDISGSIPPELGDLASLRVLDLGASELTGPIPPELGRLENLTRLVLHSNNLTGPVPPEFGNLDRARAVYLYSNSLQGPLPPELGNLQDLDTLIISHNQLTGTLPPGLGNAGHLKVVDLSSNARLSGRLPRELTRLDQVLKLDLGGTGLCGPDDPEFLDWLSTIDQHRVALCEGATAYLTQSVQSRRFPVPLIAGEDALLRVFMTATRVTTAGIPPVRATFFMGDREVHAVEIPGRPQAIPTHVDPATLLHSANALVPGRIVQPGLGMVIDVDPHDELDPSLGVQKRIPETGSLSLDVRAAPELDLTLIPYLWADDPDSTMVRLVQAMEADPRNHELLLDTRMLLPTGELNVTAHRPVVTSTRNPVALLRATRAIRSLEGGQGHYMGMLPETGQRIMGVAYLSATVSFSIPDSNVMAHELGHNMSLRHAPCGRPAGVDAGFPQPDGSIGEPGYDFRDGGRLVPPDVPDLMSYCRRPHWMSEYGFSKALRYRLLSESQPNAMAAAIPTKSLLLWGGISAQGVPYLDPAFVVDATPVAPAASGEYRLEGTTASGQSLFSLDFEMPEMADADSTRAFVFTVPAQPSWAGELTTITFSGPEGSVSLHERSNRPGAILLDTRRQQVRGILLNLPGDPRAQADAVTPSLPGIEVLFSRGIPDAGAWRQ